MTPVTEQFAEVLIKRMNIGPRDRILDAGCGEGWLARLLARLVTEGLVVGLDSSSDAIHAARSQSTSIENLIYVWGEAENIPWQEGFFSRVLCVDSLPYFADPHRALAELHRVLSPGASLWVLNQLSEQAAPSPVADPVQNSPLHRLSVEEYRSLFEQCGFRDFSPLSLTPLAAAEHDASAAEPQQVEGGSISLMTAFKEEK
jgi:ubiquinone/menaquinone biosynthesis C-methylase UbiE